MKVFCVGNGVSTFVAPPKKGEAPYAWTDEAAAAAQQALDEAGVRYDQVDAVVCAYAFSDSTAGQAACYKLGLTGVPVFNVNNACASGASALCMARALCQGGGFGCVLVLGFENLRGTVKEAYPAHDVYGGHLRALEELGVSTFPGVVAVSIANAYIQSAKDFLEERRHRGASEEHFAAVAHKNRRHGAHNPRALLGGGGGGGGDGGDGDGDGDSGGVPTPGAILGAPRLFDDESPLTYAMVAPSACGAAAAVLVGEQRLGSLAAPAGAGAGGSCWAVEIAGCALRTDLPDSFAVASAPRAALANLCGFSGARRAADAALAEAGLVAADVDVAEVHDAFASSEMAACEALRLCDDSVAFVDGGVWLPTAQGGELFHQPRRQRGGRQQQQQQQQQQAGTVVVNPSGGLESKGHPTGATGLAQCAECCWQLRGVAGKRQVPGARTALAHNYGWSSAAVVTVFRGGGAGGGAPPQARL